MKSVNSLVQYFAQVRQELGKVTWPSRDQTIKMTALVLGISTVIGVYLGSLDFFLAQLFGLIIKR